MNKALIGISMLVLACIVCGPASAITGVPHAPIAVNNVETPPGSGTFIPTPACNTGDEYPPLTPYGAPITYTGPKPTGAGSLPIFALYATPEPTPITYDYPVTSWPVDGAWDFCAAFDTVACSLGALSGFSTDIGSYAALFVCSTDINGTPLTVSPYVQPNGVPDGEFELGLLAAVLNNTPPLLDSAKVGKTNAEIRTAFEANFQFFKVFITKALGAVPLNDPPAPPSDLRSTAVSIIPWVPSGLVMILCGFATEGDVNTIAALDSLVGQLDALGLTPPPGGISGNTTGFSSILSPEGDADGDGFTNRQEYNYFKNNPDQGSTPAATVIKAQLTASVMPPATIPKVTIYGPGTAVEAGPGSQLELKAVPENCTALHYAWYHNGAPVGSDASSLVKSDLVEADSGTYKCIIDIGGGELVTSNELKIVVVAEGTLPIAGGLGLALLAGACALGGVGSIRRRK